MALGEEKAEAAADAKAPCPGGWSCPEQEPDPAGPSHREQLPHLEAEGGPASAVGGAQGHPACHGGAGPGPSGACQPQANGASREPAAGGSKPALSSLLPPASLGTGDLHSVRSQVGAEASGAVASPKAVL